jgi:hypothetical protein
MSVSPSQAVTLRIEGATAGKAIELLVMLNIHCLVRNIVCYWYINIHRVLFKCGFRALFLFIAYNCIQFSLNGYI